MPFVARLSLSLSYNVLKMISKFKTPLPNGFIAENDSSKSQLFLDISIAVVETVIKLNGLTDD
jgi:hypothetical protein